MYVDGQQQQRVERYRCAQPRRNRPGFPRHTSASHSAAANRLAHRPCALSVRHCVSVFVFFLSFPLPQELPMRVKLYSYNDGSYNFTVHLPQTS